MTDKTSRILLLVYVLVQLLIFYALWPTLSEWESHWSDILIFEALFLLSTWLTQPYRKVAEPDAILDIGVIIRHAVIWGGLFMLIEFWFLANKVYFPYLEIIGLLSGSTTVLLIAVKLVKKTELKEAIKPVKRARVKLEFQLTQQINLTDVVKDLSIGKKDIKKSLSGRVVKLPENGSEVKVLPKPVKHYLNINAKLKELHERLPAGGVALISYTPEDIREQKILSIKPGLLSKLLYIFYLFWFRALPKVPYLSQVLLYASAGRWRAISRTETWGRILYTGFDMEEELDLGDGRFLIVARKQFEPMTGVKPSFYPIIQLNRVGFHGKTIKIFKFRSMYPYSEFLQEKVYEMNSLDNSGKFKDDFRITQYGKYIRKFWLDELPQMVNWLRGDIKIVGIRAMSFHYFSLYPQWYKDIYYTVKPGFVSPIFDENTASFDEIVNIEGDYLKKYRKNGLKADVTFFFETFFQIIGGVRSK
ncbi:sugar transferase [Roseivirga misakiensis]|uniref:Bacterial sugar transferase domain-containing protein n=1 Tax=Roseivirga misakiensis TaxID=1563681 RepID=A0A1E5T5W7_9BACT|nr:sugar transferase [Roseivirga misakiensis]OEK06769.1 hypothetical protein BFP71_03660 [Roseivirga misakiensis]